MGNRLLDESALASLLIPFLDHKPYRRTGDMRTCRCILDDAYNTNLKTYNGRLDDVSFRDILVAYSNLSAAPIVCIFDDTDGRGLRSTSAGVAQCMATEIANTSVTARQRAKLESQAAIRHVNGSPGSIHLCREAVRPLKSLRNWRAHSTGSYALYCRYTSDHVQPIKLGRRGTSGRVAAPAQFWGNNKTAVRSSIRSTVPAIIKLDAPLVVEPIAQARNDLHMQTLDTRAVLLAPRKCMLVPDSHTRTAIDTRGMLPTRCLERSVHRRIHGFQGPERCMVCTSLRVLARNHRTLSCWTVDPNGGVSYSLRTSVKRNYDSDDTNKHVIIKRENRRLYRYDGDILVDSSMPILPVAPAIKMTSSSISAARSSSSRSRPPTRELIINNNADAQSSLSSNGSLLQ